MKIAIRTDASFYIGTGHVFRCLSLAEELRKAGNEVIFFCADLPGNLFPKIKNIGFKAFSLPVNNLEEKDYFDDLVKNGWKLESEFIIKILDKEHFSPDLFIIDNYFLDERFEKKIRPITKKIFVIDDLANRKHDCDILLDQNFYNSMNTRYIGLIPDSCIKLLGPEFVILREEFLKIKDNKRKNITNSKNKILMIFFGGSDNTDETSKVLIATESLNNSLIINVVIGYNNKYKNNILKFKSNKNLIKFYVNIDNISELMMNSDLFIGSGGITTFERCYMGLPSIVITTAKNQIQAIKDMDFHKYLYYLGHFNEIDEVKIYETINEKINDIELLDNYRKKSFSLVDGYGISKIIHTICR